MATYFLAKLEKSKKAKKDYIKKMCTKMLKYLQMCNCVFNIKINVC